MALSTVYLTKLEKQTSMILQNTASVIISFCGYKLEQFCFARKRGGEVLTAMDNLIRYYFTNFLVVVYVLWFQETETALTG